MHHQAVTPTDPRKSYSVKSKSINKSRIPLNYNSRPPSLTSSTTSLASNSTSPTPRSVTDTILANSIPFPSVIHHDTAISHSNNSALDPGWLLAHSKDEMAELLNKADRLIKSNQTGDLYFLPSHFPSFDHTHLAHLKTYIIQIWRLPLHLAKPSWRRTSY